MPNPFLAAERVLNEIPVTSPDDLRFLKEIAWERGALVREKHLTGFEARLVIGRNHAIITISSAVANPRRKRFDIAHEIGHLEMHRWSSYLMLCTNQDINDQVPLEKLTISQIEKEANLFASALLLPERFFAPLVRAKEPSLDHISELADMFDISLTATALRYTRYCQEPIALVFSQANRIKWFQGSNEFDELGVYIDVRARLDPATLASRLFAGRKVSRRPAEVKSSTWFTSEKYNPEATIQEQSWSMGSYDATLTLLWVDDDIENEDEFGFDD